MRQTRKIIRIGYHLALLSLACLLGACNTLQSNTPQQLLIVAGDTDDTPTAEAITTVTDYEQELSALGFSPALDYDSQSNQTGEQPLHNQKQQQSVDLQTLLVLLEPADSSQKDSPDLSPIDGIEPDQDAVSEPAIGELKLDSGANQILAEEIKLEAIAALEKQSSAWHRLRQGMQLTPVKNKRVEVQIKWYLEHRGYLQRVMERARPILPFILDELESRNLPTELALLPIVESAYQAFAYSHGRASGLWQIIPSTGRHLGLKQNWWYDGRRDIIESTRAAIHYLDSLSKQFDGDWELALASYNAGPGKIRSAVRHNKARNKATDFWHLTRIRNETRAYVPKLFALKEIFENPDRYEIDLVPVGNEVSYEVVELEGQIDLALAADLADMPINELYQLNPAFNRWATAPKGPHRLLLPKEKVDRFRLALEEIPAHKRINWVRHKIRNGETLSQISNKYRTTIALIKSVNSIRGTQIRAGKYLMIPTATKSIKSYTLSANSRINTIQNTNRAGQKQFHIVRSGQSLWSISRNYGVTTAALAKWNGMAPIDTLRIGQKLVVWTSRGPSIKRTGLNVSAPRQNLHALRYTVRSGDSLSRIADRFNIRVVDIKRWNQIGRYLQPGQKLKLYVDITKQSG